MKTRLKVSGGGRDRELVFSFQFSVFREVVNVTGVVLRWVVFAPALALGLMVFTASIQAAAPAANPARRQLITLLSAMRSVQAIKSEFVCEKKLQVLKKPFWSRGVITMARPRQVRFETIWPYKSCYILDVQHIYMRNESDRHWRKTTVNSQPAIGIIMRQFAAWSLGDAAKASSQYHIAMQRSRVPRAIIPNSQATRSIPAKHHAAPVRMMRLFTLRPKDGVLARAIGELQLGFAPVPRKPAAGAGAESRRELKFIRIVSKNGDQSLFWLRHTVVNPLLKSNDFVPAGPE
jgi:hypothetical protein